MRDKPYMVGNLLGLALMFACATDVFAVVSTTPALAGQGGTPQLKSIAEDSGPWRREPFKSSDTTKIAPGMPAKFGITRESADISLQGIMKSNKSYFAIINGITVKPGDRIEGWTIAEISRHRVTMRREKEKQIYDIYQGRIDRGVR
jgi:hypothetical protein